MRIAVPVSNDRTAETLSGIPSIIYGLVGQMFFCQFLGMKKSLIAGAMTLVIMKLPTIMRTTQESRAVRRGRARLRRAARRRAARDRRRGHPALPHLLRHAGGSGARLFGRHGRPRPEQQMQRLRLSVLLLTERQGRLRQRLTQKSVPHRGTLFSYSPQVRLRLPEVTSTGGLAER